MSANEEEFTYDDLNERLARNSKPNEEFHLRVMCFNIANAKRDEEFKPLLTRIIHIVKMINRIQSGGMDAFILLEAGRSSVHRTWSMIASYIEEQTGFRYVFNHYLNSSNDSFSKCLFIDPSRVACLWDKQMWTEYGHKKDFWSGAGFWGNSVSLFQLFPVVHEQIQLDPNPEKPKTTVRRVIADAWVNIGACHFPPGGMADRIKASNWLRDHASEADIWMGDFNTYPDDGGEEMIKIITSNGLVQCDLKVPFTFKCFDHDIVTKPASFEEKINPESKIIERTTDKDGNPIIKVLFASVLDHVFHHGEKMKKRVEIKYAKALDVDHNASDHAPVYVDFIIRGAHSQ